MAPNDLSKFSGFFDKVIRDYHGDETNEKTHTTDWSVEEGTDFDVSKLGQDQARWTRPSASSSSKRWCVEWRSRRSI